VIKGAVIYNGAELILLTEMKKRSTKKVLKRGAFMKKCLIAVILCKTTLLAKKITN
jgi:hypothetical protein